MMTERFECKMIDHRTLYVSIKTRLQLRGIGTMMS